MNYPSAALQFAAHTVTSVFESLMHVVPEQHAVVVQSEPAVAHEAGG